MKGRFGNLANYALNCVQRYKVRTFVILICLSVAAAIFSSVAFLKDGLTREAELSLKYAPDITVQGIESGRQAYLNSSALGYSLGSAGIKAVAQRIWGYGNVGNTLLVVVGLDMENMAYNPIAPIDLSRAYPIESGTFLEPCCNNSVVVGKAVADLLGVKVGRRLTILSESNQPFMYEVVGIFNSESTIYNADMILMNLNDARAFFSVPEGLVTDLEVYIGDVDDASYTRLVNYAARQISDMPNVRVVTKDILRKAQESTFDARSGFFSVMWLVILIAVAIVAFNQTVVVGHESKFEVGLLKALGFSTTDVIQVRLIESAVLGTLAGSIGLVAGILFDVLLKAPVLRDFMLGWAALYPNFAVPTYISLQTISVTFLITIVPLLFATVIPSWLNATVDPDLAMRGARA